MATLTLPISELSPVVFAAKEQTECVVSYSKAVVADFATACAIITKTLSLRSKFSRLVTRQAKLIDSLVERDFNSSPTGELLSLAVSIDDLVADERALLSLVGELGSEIRVWWNTSLIALSEQVEHLDSLAESLHLASDDEASSLLAFALEEFSSPRVEQLAMR